MEFEGVVYKIMPATKGTSARGDWQEGATYTVSVNIESREYNGRWYTDVRAWRVQPKQEAAPAPMPDMPPVGEEPSYTSSAASAEVDDLPF